ncbi:hypothetical protein KAH94_03965 [bacterium]|nr:hypothetical protein [bacterium]
MEIINKLRLAIEGLERKDFFKYLFIILSIITFVFSVIVYRYYSKINELKVKIEDINETREETVHFILKRMNTVERQRKHVNDILKKEKDFKIAGYFADLLVRQNLTEKKALEITSIVVLSNEFREVRLKVQFIAITMKQLCQLLDEIEKTERVYAKDLEIDRSTKAPKTINVNITVATLQPQMKAGI